MREKHCELCHKEDILYELEDNWFYEKVYWVGRQKMLGHIILELLKSKEKKNETVTWVLKAIVKSDKWNKNSNSLLKEKQTIETARFNLLLKIKEKIKDWSRKRSKNYNVYGS